MVTERRKCKAATKNVHSGISEGSAAVRRRAAPTLGHPDHHRTDVTETGAPPQDRPIKWRCRTATGAKKRPHRGCRQPARQSPAVKTPGKKHRGPTKKRPSKG